MLNGKFDSPHCYLKASETQSYYKMYPLSSHQKAPWFILKIREDKM